MQGEIMEAKGKINGVDVDQLFSTIGQIKNKPALGQFQFRTLNKWIDGTHNQAAVSGYYGAGQEFAHGKNMVFNIDEPPILGGKDEGGNPVEYLLVALSGCLTTTLVAHAAAKGITLKNVESRLEGDIDLRGFLGISEEVKVGFEQIRVFFKIDADISEAQKEELIRMAQKHSPVWNTISHQTPVLAQLEKVAAPATA
jgi:uncharacterized OsmC-like protein